MLLYVNLLKAVYLKNFKCAARGEAKEELCVGGLGNYPPNYRFCLVLFDNAIDVSHVKPSHCTVESSSQQLMFSVRKAYLADSILVNSNYENGGYLEFLWTF